MCYIGGWPKPCMAVQSMAAAEEYVDAEEVPPYLRPFGGLERCARAMEDMLGGDSGRQISMFLLVSRGDIIEAIRNAGPMVKIEKSAGVRPNMAVALTIAGSSREKSGRLLVAQAGTPQVYLALTDGRAPFVGTLPSVLEKMHPYAYIPRFSSVEILSMLELLESKTGLALATRRITAHGRINKGAAHACNAKKLGADTGRVGSEAVHPSAPYRESIQSALENDQWVDKAHFALSDGNSVRLEGYFSRNGMFKIRRSFLIFKEHVLPYIVSVSTKKFKLYSNRSKEDNGGEVSPLVIKLEAGTFSDRKENHRFIEAVQRMKYTSGGVYHSNPYVHMSLVDHMDGSTFKIWVMSPDKITIVPQLRATQASISRLIAHIFERYQEGEVVEYEQ